jgi:hypothetical protein
VFLRMLLGGIRWTTGLVDADVRPDIATLTPHASDIPQRASKFIPEKAPAENRRFPGFKVWLDRDYKTSPRAQRILVFTKSAGHENLLNYRDTANPSPLETEFLRFGEGNDIDFIFSKDGTYFTPENIAGFDAFLFYTSGDLTDGTRRGPGDNYKMMTAAGKQSLIEAVRQGKGLVALDSTIESLPEILSGAHPTSTEGKGRVFYTPRGGDAATWRDPGFRKMLLDGLNWTTRPTATRPKSERP